VSELGTKILVSETAINIHTSLKKETTSVRPDSVCEAHHPEHRTCPSGLSEPQNTPVSVITQNTLASVITQNTPVRTQLLVPDIAQNIFVSSVSIRKKNISSKIFQCQTKKNKSVRLSVTQNQEHTYQASPHQRELRTHCF